MLKARIRGISQPHSGTGEPGMLIADLALPEFEEEMAFTHRILESVPAGRLNWKPHPKSMSLGRLAMHVAELPKWASDAFTLDEVDIGPVDAPSQVAGVNFAKDAILDRFLKHSQAARAALIASTDEKFAEHWTLRAGNRVYRSALNHLVHHRGQLSVYLRLNDVAVLGAYGPSADDLESATRAD